MRRSLFVLIGVVAIMGGAVALARLTRCHSPGGAVAGKAGAVAGKAGAVAGKAGAVAGNFDPVMSGVCRYSCATKLEYRPADVIAQPGAIAGKLTQCPVSGVVFLVASDRPHVAVGGKDYVACCGNCAAKLRADPARYLKA